VSIGFLEIHFKDLVDILLVAILLFNLYKMISNSLALRIFIGFLALYLFYLVMRALRMELLSDILGQFMGVSAIAAIIIFQQEIRKILLIIGKSTNVDTLNSLNLFGRKSKKTTVEDQIFTQILDAMKAMSSTNTGALIVMNKSDDMHEYAETGDLIEGVVSKRLLLSIFYKNSPLHDGAVIIFKDRIRAARCILPVTDKQDIPASMGLRHRAAIGITEHTNSIVLVVSEETGMMSFVEGGVIFDNLSYVELRKKLKAYFQSVSSLQYEIKRELAEMHIAEEKQEKQKLEEIKQED
jgi:uncharacterized protein (TIGR00159 family)